MGRRRRRRHWSDDEKREICRQATVPGVSVSLVGRRYDVNANQVFNWLKDPRFAPAPINPEPAEPVFLPVEILPVDARPAGGAVEAQPTIEVTLPTGVGLTIRGAFDPDAVVRLIRGLEG